MNIIDTFPQIANCFADDIFNMEYWENYANAISPGLAAKCKEDIADYNFQKDVLPLLNNVAHHFSELEIAHQSFLSLTDGLRKRYKILCKQIATDLLSFTWDYVMVLAGRPNWMEIRLFC